MKLLNRFYQISAPSLTHSYDASAYLLDTDSGLYLIDCGTPQGYKRCLENIRSLGYEPRDIKAIIGTHGHFDHIGAAKLFYDEFGIPLYLHHDDREQVESADPIKTTASLLYGSTFPACRVTEELHDQQRFDFGSHVLEILHTPGHTPGSVCIVLYTDLLVVLIAADTLYGGFIHALGSDDDAWRRSLDILSSRSFDVMSFGHCSPGLLSDVNSRIDCAKRSFAKYYVPWFKDFTQQYAY